MRLLRQHGNYIHVTQRPLSPQTTIYPCSVPSIPAKYHLVQNKLLKSKLSNYQRIIARDTKNH